MELEWFVCAIEEIFRGMLVDCIVLYCVVLCCVVFSCRWGFLLFRVPKAIAASDFPNTSQCSITISATREGGLFVYIVCWRAAVYLCFFQHCVVPFHYCEAVLTIIMTCDLWLYLIRCFYFLRLESSSSISVASCQFWRCNAPRYNYITTWRYILCHGFAPNVAVGIYFNVWSDLHSSGILRSAE
jgi:hypothetical protein